MLVGLIRFFSPSFCFFLSPLSPCSLKMKWYIITVYISTFKSSPSKWDPPPTTPPFLSCSGYYLYHIWHLSCPLIKFSTLMKLMAPYANSKRSKEKSVKPSTVRNLCQEYMYDQNRVLFLPHIKVLSAHCVSTNGSIQGNFKFTSNLQ